MDKEAFALKFRRNANSLAVRYGAPVLLVGGALVDEHPRDYDVRIVLSEEDHKRQFKGVSGQIRDVKYLNDFEDWEWRRGYDCLKHSRVMSVRMRVCVDFQIQSEHEAQAWKDLPSVRLDTAPDWFFKAGKKGTENE
jgi:hypothetical protein